jgi:hypothetical protein
MRRSVVPGLLAATAWWLLVAGPSFGVLIRVSLLFILSYLAVEGSNWAAFLVGLVLILVGIAVPLSTWNGGGPIWLIVLSLGVAGATIYSGRRILALRPALANQRPAAGVAPHDQA